jgi:hypothetical protein
MNDGSEVKSAVAVNAVKSDDECFAALSALKSGDFVVVTPLKNGSTWDVDAVYVPTTASGSISDVKVNAADKNTSALTVDGTTYNMSRNWTAEDAGGNRTSVLNSTSVTTKQDSTVYIDSYGYAIYVANVQATTSFFLFDEVSSQTVGSKIHYIAEGWDTKGNAVSLDFGTQNPDLDAGTVYAYKTAASNSAADYAIDWAKTSDQVISGTGSFTADQTKIGGVYFASGVKFIFPSWENGDITGVTVRSGSQNLSSTKYQYVLDKASDSDSNKITAVFLSSDKDVEVSTNVLYVQKQTWATANDDAKVVSKFTGYINGEKVVDASANKRVTDNTFYTYSYNESTGIYTVNAYTSSSGKTTSVLTNAWFNNEDLNKGKKAYLDGGSTVVTEDNDYLTTSLNLANATVIDLRDGGTLASASNMAEADYTAYKVSLVYNDSSSSSERGRVSYVFILGTDTVTHDATTKYTVTAPTGTLVSADGTTWGTTARILGDIGTKFYLKADGDYMFSDDPDLDNNKLDGSTATYEGDGVYSVALKALVSTQADADALTGSSVIANTHVVKLTASHFEFISGTPTLYLQFHDNTDTLDDGSSYGNLANIAREVMVKEGYTNAYIDGSGDVEFISGGQLYTLTILAKNTIVFKVDGVTEFADGSSAHNMDAIDHASKYTGTYWKDKSDGSYKPVSSTAVADGEEYESGYYKVTQPTTDTIADVTYTVTDSADATHYVHKDGSFTVTVTLSGAASAATKATFTVTKGNIVENTLSASSGTAAGETVAVTTSNTKVEITPVNGNTSTAVYTFTVKPDGVGDVSVALA